MPAQANETMPMRLIKLMLHIPFQQEFSWQNRCPKGISIGPDCRMSDQAGALRKQAAAGELCRGMPESACMALAPAPVTLTALSVAAFADMLPRRSPWFQADY